MRRVSGAADWLRSYYRPYKSFFFGSGTQALAAVLCILKNRQPERTTVLLSGYTCPALVSAIRFAGCRPYPLDTKPGTHFIAGSAIEKAIDRSTLAVIGTDLFGIRERYSMLGSVARKHGAYVIEDAAQRKHPPPINDDVDAVVVSYGRGKPNSVLGGGALLLRSTNLLREASRFYDTVPRPSPVKDHMLFIKAVSYKLLRQPRLYWIPAGMPFLGLGRTQYRPLGRIERMPGMLLSWLPANLVASDRQRRQALRFLKQTAQHWRPFLVPVRADFGSEEPSLSRMALLACSPVVRNRILQALRKYGASPMYPAPVSDIPGAFPNSRDSREGELINARDFSRRVITLPLHEWMNEDSVRQVSHEVERQIETDAMEVTE